MKPEETEEKIEKSAELIHKRKSKNREDIEKMPEQIEISLDHKVNVFNLDNREQHFFDDYAQAIEFMKGKKGRWYVTNPGVRYNEEKTAER